MSEYTRGPLTIRPEPFRTHSYFIIDETIGAIGIAYAGFIGPGNATSLPAEANARLWAASPTLLEACKAVLFPAGDTAEQIQAQLLAAIQKAEGMS